ncbi:MAG TPA: Uma2 family endonuclease [Thermoleophilaceae bacterium]|jgi:Uma2 family endonuclease
MATTTERITVEEYYAITESDPRLTQLIDGRIVHSHPRPIHGLIQLRLATALGTWAEATEGRGLAVLTTDVVMDRYNAYGPDVLWIAERHRPADLDERIKRVPDLCVEVRSPSTWRYDVGTKKRVYEAGSLPELWLVDDVAECVMVFRRSHPEAPVFDVELELTAGDELTSPQLPGFALSLERLFRRS